MALFGSGKRDKKQSGGPVKVAAERWDLYSYRYGDGQRAVISFDMDAAAEERHQGYGHCRRVIVFLELDKVGGDGLPADKQELVRLQEMQADLLGRLEQGQVDCRFVGSMTYGGMREFVFQVEELAAFEDVVARWMKTLGDQKVEVVERDGWGFFDEKVRPSPVDQQQLYDRRVIDQLIKAGSDPERPHSAEHMFKGPPAMLHEISRRLGEKGFELVSLDGDVLVMSQALFLDLEEVSTLTGALFSLSKSMGVSYDGWGARVVP